MTWLACMCDASCTRVTWLVCIHAYIYIYKHMCVYICTHVYTSASSYVYEYISPIRTSQYEQLICITNLTQEVWEGVHLCSLLIYARHDSCTCATWLIYMCDMTHSYVWHDSGELGLRRSGCAYWVSNPAYSYVRYDSPPAPMNHVKKIEGWTPRDGLFGTGTTVVQNISAQPWWSGGNEKPNLIE